MQGFFSQTTNAIALKLHTLIGHHQMTVQDKSHNSTSEFYTFMGLFGNKKFWLKFYQQDTIMDISQ